MDGSLFLFTKTLSTLIKADQLLPSNQQGKDYKRMEKGTARTFVLAA